MLKNISYVYYTMDARQLPKDSKRLCRPGCQQSPVGGAHSPMMDYNESEFCTEGRFIFLP